MATKKPIYMENTEVPADRTASEISACLIQAGATSISTKYDGGKIVGLSWAMTIAGRDIHFAMPARVEPVYQLLCNRRSQYGETYMAQGLKTRLRDQAERVAWRQLLRWVQAQIAMIDVGMVQSAEVFMPYMQQADGRTMFEYFESTQLRLDAGKPS